MRESIVNKIALVMIVISLFAVFASNYVISSHTLKQYYEQTKRSNKAHVNSVVGAFEQDLRAIEASVYGIRHSIKVEEIVDASKIMGGLTQYENELVEHFSRLLSGEDRVSDSVYLYLSPFLDNDVHDVWMTTDNGVLTRHDEVPLERYINNDNMSWYYVPQAHGEGLWLEPYRNRYNQLVSSYVVPIFRGDDYLGMMGMYLSFDRAQSLIEDRNGYKDDAILIVNDQGEVLNKPDDLSAYDMYFNTDVYEMYESKTYNGWSFQYFVNKAEVEALRADVERRIVVTLFIVVVLILSIGQFFRVRYKQIFNVIMNGIENLMLGDYTHEVHVQTKDELGEIGTALNHASLKIKKYSEELEKNIAERTVLLKYTNEELEKVKSNLQGVKEELDQSKKNENMSRFIIEIAHRMNAPIGNAKTSVSYLDSIQNRSKRKRISSTEELEEVCHSMEKATNLVRSDIDEIASIVNGLQLLNVGKNPGIQSKFNLENLMNYTLQSYSTGISNNRTLSYEVESGRRIELYASQAHFIEITNNLLKYSESYSVADKNIQVKILIRRIDDYIELDYMDNSKLFFTEMGHIAFEPFALNTFEKGVSGLELMMVYNLVTTGLCGTVECLEAEAGRPYFRINIPINQN